MAGIGRSAVGACGEQQVTGLDLGQRYLRTVLLPLVGGAGDVDARGGVGGEDQAAAVEAGRTLAAPAVGLADLGTCRDTELFIRRAAAREGSLSFPCSPS